MQIVYQLILYIHRYATQLEQTVIDTLKDYGIEGERSEVNTGGKLINYVL